MGRKSTFTDQLIYSAVSKQISSGNEFRIQELAEHSGVSVGSLYHRFGSREGILAEAWLDALTEFQNNFINTLKSRKKNAGEMAALATPHFSRCHKEKAIILSVSRQESLMNEEAPVEVRKAAEALNEESKSVLTEFCQSRDIDLQAGLHAIVAFPLASVRLYLPTKDVPRIVDQYVLSAYKATIRIRGGN